MSTTSGPTRRSEFLAGAKDTFPLVVGAVPFGIIFGAVAGPSGLSVGGAAAMSAFVFAGSAQFIATTLLQTGASTAVIILTTFVVNLRHALYSASLAPHMKHLPQRWLFPLAFWLTDETFVVVIAHYSKEDDSPYKHWYFLGSAVFMYVNWQLCTWVGIFAGTRIQNPQNWGLDFAMIAAFTGMLVPFVKNRPALVSIIVAGITAVLANSLPNKLGLILAALLGVMAGLAAESLWPAQESPKSVDPVMPEASLQEGNR